MIPNIHQSVDEIIKASTPAQKILWQQVRLISGENAAIRQLHYAGTVTGTEFLTATTGKIYFAYELNFSQENSTGFITQGFVTLGGIAGFFGTMYYSNNAVYWNATAAAIYFTCNDIMLRNVLFTNIAVARYRNVHFIGYRIQG